MMKNLMNHQRLPNFSIIERLNCPAALNIFVSLFFLTIFKTSVKQFKISRMYELHVIKCDTENIMFFTSLCFSSSGESFGKSLGALS